MASERIAILFDVDGTLDLKKCSSRERTSRGR